MITQRLLDEFELNAEIEADKMLADIEALHLGERASNATVIPIPEQITQSSMPPQMPPAGMSQQPPEAIPGMPQMPPVGGMPNG